MSVTSGWPFGLMTAPSNKFQFSVTALRDYLLTYGESWAKDLLFLVWRRSGIFPAEAGLGFDPLDLQAGGANDTIRVRDGAGLIRDAAYDHPPLPDWEDPGDITIENELATVYHIGMRVAKVPVPDATGIGTNQKTGTVEYLAERLEVGELGHPDGVTDNGDGTVTLNVQTLMQGAEGVVRDHGSRPCRVWLDTPVDPAPAVAFVTDTAHVDGVWIVEAIDDLGQTAHLGAPSVDPNDYWVLVTRPAVRTTDLSLDSAYLYLGNVTGIGAGNPVGAIDTSGVYRFKEGLELDLVWQWLSHPFGLLEVRSYDASPLKYRNNAGPAVDEVYAEEMVFSRGADKVPVVVAAGFLPAAPPDNQSSLITYNPATESWDYWDYSNGTFPGRQNVIVGLVVVAATDITRLEFWPQWSRPSSDMDGLEVIPGDPDPFIVVNPGRCTMQVSDGGEVVSKEFINPFPVALNATDASSWDQGIVGDNSDAVMYVYVGAHPTENWLQPFLSNQVPTQGGYYPAVLTPGVAANGARYVGAIYRQTSGGAPAPYVWPQQRAGERVVFTQAYQVASGVSPGAFTEYELPQVPRTARAALFQARIVCAFADFDPVNLNDRTAFCFSPQAAGAFYQSVEVTSSLQEAAPGPGWSRRQCYIEVPLMDLGGSGAPSIWLQRAMGGGTLTLELVGYIENRKSPLMLSAVAGYVVP